MKIDKPTIYKNILFLNRDDIIKLGGYDPELYVNIIKDVLMLHTSNKCILPNESYLRFGDYKTEHKFGRFICMPGYIGGEFNVAGIKWISSHSKNPINCRIPRAIGIIILNEPSTGLPICILDGGLISAMRTAAITTIAIEHLAKKDFKVLSIIGLGVIARAHMKFFAYKKFNFDDIKVFDISKDAATSFKKNIEGKYGYKISIKKDAEDAIKMSDIILATTTTSDPYIMSEWIKEGALLCNISLFDPKDNVFINADKIVVDDLHLANKENRPLNILLKEGRLSKENVYELGEIIYGEKKGREYDSEKILFNPMGLAIEDLSVASFLYQKAKRLSIGIQLHLNDLWEGLL